jgi:hypothetical protein
MARQLAIAKVSSKDVACVFAANCAVTPTDTMSYFKMFGDSGSGRVLSRSYPGMPGTKAAGLTGYSFTIDMRGATTLGMPNCVKSVMLDTGPLAKLDYAGKAEIFVVDSGAGAGVSSVSQSGSKLNISFARAICPGTGAASQSLYFGFAAKTGPAWGKGQVNGSLQGSADFDVRTPKHGGPDS